MPDLKKHATEQSTYPITVTFTDDDGVEFTPNDDITWSLVDENHAIVNDKEDVPFTPPASSITIVLEGDDLAMLTINSKERRCLVVECTYDSDLGTGKPFKGQQWFVVDGLEKVT